MKPDIHPEYHPVVFVDGEHEVVTRSTMTSAKTRDIDGVEHFVIDVAISSFTHPFWTGTMKILDTAGRVERFNRKYGRTKKDDEAKADAPKADAPKAEAPAAEAADAAPAADEAPAES